MIIARNSLFLENLLINPTLQLYTLVMANQLILSVDLDEWYHCRWATGSKIARWKNTQEFFHDYYRSNKPIGEIIEPTRQILRMLKRANIKATFFILGEVAEWYPRLVQEISKAGHEIACHGMHHQDLTLITRENFSKELAENRKILQKISGQSIIGFRAPNLVVTSWLHRVLIEQKFFYDSSVCPARSLQGKYKNQAGIQPNPYRVSNKSILKKGDSKLIEIPIPAFPILKVPGAVSIATRIFGWRWTKFTLDSALKTGTACYYIHPYEFNSPPKLFNISFKQKIFMRRMGPSMINLFRTLLKQYQERIIPCKEYILKVQEQNEYAKKIFKD